MKAGIRLTYLQPANPILLMFGWDTSCEVEVEVVEIDYDAGTAVILLPVPPNSILGISARQRGITDLKPIRRTVQLEHLKANR